jgi:C1A family cysteine protease
MALTEFVPTEGGWRPDLSDFRDWTIDDDRVSRCCARAGLRLHAKTLPPRVNLRSGFTRLAAASCLRDSSVHAVLALWEFHERQSTGTTTPRAARFLYKTARRLSGSPGDGGVGLRDVWKALVRFGCPPEQFCPGDPAQFDAELDPFLYGFQREFRNLRWIRLDQPERPAATLPRVKQWLAAGYPSVFGFSVPTSLSRRAEIPYRPTYDGIRGGVAVVALGYDDRRLGSTKGALLIRTCWGADWGLHGYGWLPYAYVTNHATTAHWVMISRSRTR